MASLTKQFTVVLGYLIEKITGGSYERFVEESIYTPLGMKDSGYDSNAAVVRDRAAGYTPGLNGPVNAGFVHMSIPQAAGALYSTTGGICCGGSRVSAVASCCRRRRSRR